MLILQSIPHPQISQPVIHINTLHLMISSRTSPRREIHIPHSTHPSRHSHTRCHAHPRCRPSILPLRHRRQKPPQKIRITLQQLHQLRTRLTIPLIQPLLLQQIHQNIRKLRVIQYTRIHITIVGGGRGRSFAATFHLSLFEFVFDVEGFLRGGGEAEN